jgi:hypothetical protein
MALILIIVACVWFSLGTIFVLALVCAARRRMPSPAEGMPCDIAAVARTYPAPNQESVVIEKEIPAAAESNLVELADDQVAR